MSKTAQRARQAKQDRKRKSPSKFDESAIALANEIEKTFTELFDKGEKVLLQYPRYKVYATKTDTHYIAQMFLYDIGYYQPVEDLELEKAHSVFDFESDLAGILKLLTVIQISETTSEYHNMPDDGFEGDLARLNVYLIMTTGVKPKKVSRDGVDYYGYFPK